VAILPPKHWRREVAKEDGDDMQSTREKQKGALRRLYDLLERYLKGDFEPSQKDVLRSTSLNAKIQRCEREIAILEEKLGS
jgi:predicted metal-dependent hydrolase